jgi:hypothetical protein
MEQEDAAIPDWWPPTVPEYVRYMYHFYFEQSYKARWRYQILEVFIIVTASSVPAAAAFGASRSVLGTLGAITAVLAGLRAVFHWQQNAGNFTKTFMAIDGQVCLFTASEDPYTGSDKERKLQVTVKNIVEAESLSWAQRLMANQAGEKDDNQRDGR